MNELADGDLAQRAATAREWAMKGNHESVEALFERIQSEKSRGVRLHLVAAVVSILMRHRGAHGQTPLDASRQKAIIDGLHQLDPGDMPSVLVAYAAFPDAAVCRRLARMLRQPRQDVRLGAAMAFRRSALSGACTREGPGVREWVASALGQPRLPIDAVTLLVELIGEAGYEVLRSKIVDFQRQGGGLGEAAVTALERLDARMTPEAWSGVWVDEGTDVLEEGDAGVVDWLVLEDVDPKEGVLVLPTGTARRIWAPRVGDEELFDALQVDGRTYWRLMGTRLVEFVEEQDASLAERPDVTEKLVPLLADEVGAAAMRARAILALRLGDFTTVLSELSLALKGKRPRNDLFFLSGMARIGMGKTKDGRADLERYLEKAKTKDPWRDEAAQALGG